MNKKQMSFFLIVVFGMIFMTVQIVALFFGEEAPWLPKEITFTETLLEKDTDPKSFMILVVIELVIGIGILFGGKHLLSDESEED